MGQKLDAVDILENFRGGARLRPAVPELKILQFAGFAFAKQLHHLRNLPAINLRQRKSQLLLERLLQASKIAVFAKYERHNQPVIPRADLPIRAVIPEKCSIAPLRNIRRRPSW